MFIYVKCGNCGHVAEIFKVEGSKWKCPKCGQYREMPISKDEYLAEKEKKKKSKQEKKRKAVKEYQSRLDFFK